MTVLGDQSTSTRHRRPTIQGLFSRLAAQGVHALTANEVVDLLSTGEIQDHQWRNCVYSMHEAGELIVAEERMCNITHQTAQAFKLATGPIKKRPSRAQQTREATLNDVRREVEALLRLGSIDQRCAEAVLEQLTLIRKKTA